MKKPDRYLFKEIGEINGVKPTKLFVRLLITLSLITLLVIPLSSAATLKGKMYDDSLKLTSDVVIEVDTEPAQQYLAKDGSYELNLPPGSYTLTARKGLIEVEEKVKISKEGTFVYDFFLLENLATETELWKESDENLYFDNYEEQRYETWRYIVGGIIFILLISRFTYMRKKYGSVNKFRKRMKAERKKTLNEHKADLAQEDELLDKTLEIIKKNEGRITQKKLRKELLYLSEAKVSLILTELEHKGKIEKVKKGRGNVILLRN